MSPLNVNVTMQFTGYLVVDDGVEFNFLCTDPGPSMPTRYTIKCTDAEIAAASTNPLLLQLVRDKLQRKFRGAAGIAARLDPFIGNNVNV